MNVRLFKDEENYRCVFIEMSFQPSGCVQEEIVVSVFHLSSFVLGNHIMNE